MGKKKKSEGSEPSSSGGVDSPATRRAELEVKKLAALDDSFTLADSEDNMFTLVKWGLIIVALLVGLIYVLILFGWAAPATLASLIDALGQATGMAPARHPGLSTTTIEPFGECSSHEAVELATIIRLAHRDGYEREFPIIICKGESPGQVAREFAEYVSMKDSGVSVLENVLTEKFNAAKEKRLQHAAANPVLQTNVRVEKSTGENVTIALNLYDDDKALEVAERVGVLNDLTKQERSQLEEYVSINLRKARLFMQDLHERVVYATTLELPDQFVPVIMRLGDDPALLAEKIARDNGLSSDEEGALRSTLTEKGSAAVEMIIAQGSQDPSGRRLLFSGSLRVPHHKDGQASDDKTTKVVVNVFEGDDIKKVAASIARQHSMSAEEENAVVEYLSNGVQRTCRIVAGDDSEKAAQCSASSYTTRQVLWSDTIVLNLPDGTQGEVPLIVNDGDHLDDVLASFSVQHAIGEDQVDLVRQHVISELKSNGIDESRYLARRESAGDSRPILVHHKVTIKDSDEGSETFAELIIRDGDDARIKIDEFIAQYGIDEESAVKLANSAAAQYTEALKKVNKAAGGGGVEVEMLDDDDIVTASVGVDGQQGHPLHQ